MNYKKFEKIMLEKKIFIIPESKVNKIKQKDEYKFIYENGIVKAYYNHELGYEGEIDEIYFIHNRVFPRKKLYTMEKERLKKAKQIFVFGQS